MYYLPSTYYSAQAIFHNNFISKSAHYAELNIAIRAVVVAQLVERLLPKSEV